MILRCVLGTRDYNSILLVSGYAKEQKLPKLRAWKEALLVFFAQTSLFCLFF